MTQRKHIVLFNDNKHDFNYVRACLVRYCNHTFEQAEQCVIIAHNVGKVSIKVSDDIVKLVSINNALEEKGLTTKLETYDASRTI